jgi:hypothetical protein
LLQIVEPRLIHELRSRGNNVKETIKGAGSVSAGIALMQDYEMIIDNDSINIIKELNNYAWSDKKAPLSMLLITLSMQCVMLSTSTSKT